MSVIHGSGKPRIEITTTNIYSDTVHASNISTTTVRLVTGTDLDLLDDNKILKNRLITTLNSTSEVTMGRILSWENVTDILTVDSWSNGIPVAAAVLTIGSFRIDLPFCQSLIENWTPDFITRKLANGNINFIKRGFYYSVILDYSQYADGDLVEDFATIFKTLYKDFTFYPRLDNTDIAYVVDLSPETTLQLAQAKGHRFHKLLRIELIGTRRLSDVNLKQPADTGYGYAPYGGEGYGDQL